MSFERVKCKCGAQRQRLTFRRTKTAADIAKAVDDCRIDLIRQCPKCSAPKPPPQPAPKPERKPTDKSDKDK